MLPSTILGNSKCLPGEDFRGKSKNDNDRPLVFLIPVDRPLLTIMLIFSNSAITVSAETATNSNCSIFSYVWNPFNIVLLTEQPVQAC